jgi:hypothetical protein
MNSEATLCISGNRVKIGKNPEHAAAASLVYFRSLKERPVTA